MRYEKTFSNFIDIIKGLSIGSFVASMVGILIQEKENSWYLAIFGTIFFIVTLVLSIFYDKSNMEKEDE
ncbi:MAG: hypothetical protein DSY47_03125 [Hydrogenothermus sp.]|nr:MAG: hypothetical protein DSY47_03125 [Hydrogenothermus sp.]